MGAWPPLAKGVKAIYRSVVLHLKTSLCRHHTPQAILLGLEGNALASWSHIYPLIVSCSGSDPETIDTGTIPTRYATILENKTLLLGGVHRITYDIDRDMLWRYNHSLPMSGLPHCAWFDQMGSSFKDSS